MVPTAFISWAFLFAETPLLLSLTSYTIFEINHNISITLLRPACIEVWAISVLTSAISFLIMLKNSCISGDFAHHLSIQIIPYCVFGTQILDKLTYIDPTICKEWFSQEFIDCFLVNLMRDFRNFKCWTQAWADHELQIHNRQTVQLVKVKQTKQD